MFLHLSLITNFENYRSTCSAIRKRLHNIGTAGRTFLYIMLN